MCTLLSYVNVYLHMVLEYFMATCNFQQNCYKFWPICIFQILAIQKKLRLIFLFLIHMHNS